MARDPDQAAAGSQPRSGEAVGRYWDAWHDATPAPGAYAGILDALLAPGDVRGRRVLDLGCGTGHVAALLLERGAARVVGLDRSLRSLAVARAQVPGASVVQMDLLDAPALGTFDVVLSMNAVYYADEPDRALAAAAACVAPGGCLVVGVLEENPWSRALNAARRVLARLPEWAWPPVGALAALVSTPLVALRGGGVPPLKRRIHRAVGGLFLPARKLYTLEGLERVLRAAGLQPERSAPGTGATALSRHVAVRARRQAAPKA